MKLKQVALKKLPREFIYYEFYPHYMAGNLSTTVKVSEHEIIVIATMIRTDDGDGLDELEAMLEKRAGKPIYAMMESFENGPKIVATLLKRGLYVGEWEEGSFAFVTLAKGLDVAKKAIKKIELKHAAEEMGLD